MNNFLMFTILLLHEKECHCNVIFKIPMTKLNFKNCVIIDNLINIAKLLFNNNYAYSTFLRLLSFIF